MKISPGMFIKCQKQTLILLCIHVLDKVKIQFMSTSNIYSEMNHVSNEFDKNDN